MGRVSAMPEQGRTPRIAIVRHGCYPSERHLARDVSALRDAGYAVDVICDGEQGRPYVEHIDGVTVLRIPITHKRGSVFRYMLEYAAFPLLAALTVAGRTLWRRYDYVEVRNMPDWLIIAAVIPKLLGTTAILYTYENMPELTATDHNLPLSHPLVRAMVLIERACASVADHLIAPSDMIRRILMSQGIPGEKIAVVPNVPDERVFLSHVSNRAPASTHTLSRGRPLEPSRDTHEDAFRVVTHGSLLKRYGIQTLLDAMALLRGRIPGLHLEILGEGEYRAHLEARARRLGLEDSVTFVGSVPFERVAPRLLQADVGVVPMWADLVPNKLMEYLALGLPTIITEAPGVRLYFDDSAVYYVERKNARALADAILDLYHNPDKRAALAARGHAVFRERFAWDRTRSDYLSIYRVGRPQGRERSGAQIPSGPTSERPPRIYRHMKWLPFVLGESRGPRNALTRLPTIVDRFGITPRKSVVRLERLLEVTDRYDVHPTLLVTAIVAKRHPDIVRWLMDRGVEVEAHGYVHNDYAALSRDEQIQQVQRARQELAALGVSTRGWRCPYARWNAETTTALLANGVDYDATTAYTWPAFEAEQIHLPVEAARSYARLCALYQARDARHQAVLPTMIDTLVQIPMVLPQDEDMVDRLHLDADEMARVWLRILHDTHDRGELFVINLHPERTFLCAEPLDRTLSKARCLGDVWIVTLGEIADWWRERDRAHLSVDAQEDGRWRIEAHGPDRLAISCAGQIITGSGSLLVESARKPALHCGPAWPDATRRRLREAGYVVEQGDGDGSGYALDLDPLLAADTPPDAVVRFVRERDDNLTRINPWPAGYRSCLSITGDIDAFTLVDFALRLKEF